MTRGACCRGRARCNAGWAAARTHTRPRAHGNERDYPDLLVMIFHNQCCCIAPDSLPATSRTVSYTWHSAEGGPQMFRNTLSSVAALVITFAALDAQTPATRRVAITIDDGPVVNELTDLGNFQRIT